MDNYQDYRSIQIRGLRRGSITEILLSLNAAKTPIRFDIEGTTEYSVSIHPEDVLKAVTVIKALGYETTELSPDEQTVIDLSTDILVIKQGIKGGIEDLEALGRKKGISYDPSFIALVNKLEALLK